MAFKRLNFTKTWLSPVDFPTEEDSESQVRADLQCLHDEAKNGLNALAAELEAESAAENLGARDETGAKTTVQQLLSRLADLCSGVTLAVRFAPQSLSAEQKAQARTNLGLAPAELLAEVLAALPSAEEAVF